jgi:hypothetical protein
MTTKFQVGRTYSTRSICDYDTIYRVTILSRTEKTVTIADYNGKPVRRGISLWDGVESIKPFGNYSMCAIIRADREHD